MLHICIVAYNLYLASIPLNSESDTDTLIFLPRFKTQDYNIGGYRRMAMQWHRFRHVAIWRDPFLGGAALISEYP